MKVATKANVRTTQAARRGLGPALEIAFAGGSVMGMGVVGLGVLGLGTCFLLFSKFFDGDVNRTITVITGFSLGACSIALFARVGGGIFTKAADVGADLVGQDRGRDPGRPPAEPRDDRRQRRRQRGRRRGHGRRPLRVLRRLHRRLDGPRRGVHGRKARNRGAFPRPTASTACRPSSSRWRWPVSAS